MPAHDQWSITGVDHVTAALQGQRRRGAGATSLQTSADDFDPGDVRESFAKATLDLARRVLFAGTALLMLGLSVFPIQVALLVVIYTLSFRVTAFLPIAVMLPVMLLVVVGGLLRVAWRLYLSRFWLAGLLLNIGLAWWCRLLADELLRVIND